MTPSLSVDVRPVVLVFGATDPTGGGGIQAAIEVLRSFGTHPTTVVTAISVQDTTNLHGYAPLDANIISEQARAVLEDTTVAAILIGMLPNANAVEAVNEILIDYPNIPVILAPKILSQQGVPIVEMEVIDSLVGLLFPLTTALLINSQEALRFSPNADSTEACVGYLLNQGMEFLFLTGSRDTGDLISSIIYAQDFSPRRIQSERFPQIFHGAGDTLAAAVAAGFAREDSADILFENAHAFCLESLRRGYRIGMGSNLPDRFFWLDDPDSAPA